MKIDRHKGQPSKAQMQAKAARLRSKISRLQQELDDIFNVSPFALQNGQMANPVKQDAR